MDYVKQAKKQMAVGVLGMAGMGAVGAMGAIPGMPAAASGVITTTGSGMSLLGTGVMAETGMGIAKNMSAGKKKKTKVSKGHHRFVKNILG